MKKIVLLGIVVLLIACSTGSKITKVTGEAETAYQKGNYEDALASYEVVIMDYEKQGIPQKCPVYGKAGIAAMELGNKEKAIDYLVKDTGTPSVSASTYATLAKYYHQIDNLSKEIDALEAVMNNFPESQEAVKLKVRLFETYIESENWEKAITTWPLIGPGPSSDAALIEEYFLANKSLGQDDACDSIAQQLLEIDPISIPALEWEAKKYYHKAENRYQEEMAAYEKNKTNSQYNKLVKALEVVTKDFKTSLKYFTTLYEINPLSSYATFLSNIYARLDDKKKADYYKSKIN